MPPAGADASIESSTRARGGRIYCPEGPSGGDRRTCSGRKPAGPDVGGAWLSVPATRPNGPTASAIRRHTRKQIRSLTRRRRQAAVRRTVDVRRGRRAQLAEPAKGWRLRHFRAVTHGSPHRPRRSPNRNAMAHTRCALLALEGRDQHLLVTGGDGLNDGHDRPNPNAITRRTALLDNGLVNEHHDRRRALLTQPDWDQAEAEGRLTAEDVLDRLERIALHEFGENQDEWPIAFDEDGWVTALTAEGLQMEGGVTSSSAPVTTRPRTSTSSVGGSRTSRSTWKPVRSKASSREA